MEFLLKAASEVNQLSITDYYSLVVDEIEKMSNKNEILKPLQEASNLPSPPILKRITKNAERNVLALLHGERH